MIILFLLGQIVIIPASASSPVQVIVNISNNQESLSKQGLRAIFIMRWKTWEDGTPIRVYVLEDNHPTHRLFTKQYLGVFPHQLRKAWDRKVFSGTGQAPVKVESIDEMIDKVTQTPGAIGYITSDRMNEKLRSLQIQ